ncbi:MAG: class I SAM-dependent methyltransferase [Actinomycetota bacterium]
MAGEDHDLIAEQIEYYSRRAPEYDETSAPPGDPLLTHGRRIEAALDRFRPEGRVLEIACGTGSWTRCNLRHASDLTALDSSREMLELNRRKLAGAGVRYIQADVFGWEPQPIYDVVTFANWLSHVPPARFDEFWDVVARCLAPGGRVFFTDEVKDVWRNDESLGEESLEHERAPLVRRTLRNGTTYRVVKVFWDPATLEGRLRAGGWDVTLHSTGILYWGEGTRASSSPG